MISGSRIPSLGWCIVCGSVVCMGASLAMAQRATEPRRPAGAPAAGAPATTEQPRDNAAEARRTTQPGAAGQRTDQRVDQRTDLQANTSRPYGIQFEGQDELVVGEVAPGSTAAQAGLRARDRIISVDGRPITGQRRFLAFLSGLTGRRVPLIIEREGRQYTVQFAPANTDSQGGWLGVYLEDSDDAQQGQGAKITHVYPSGPAARAGLRAGDVILQVNNKPIQGAPDLIATMDELKPQSKVNLHIMRGERELDATAVLASRDTYVMHQSRYGDSRFGDGRYGEERTGYEDRSGEEDAFANVPPYAMQLEHDRRNAEQHERIETELRKLQEEVRQLREAIQKR